MKVFNNKSPGDVFYWDYLEKNFKPFVNSVGGGSRVVRCHPSVVPLFDAIGIRPTVDEDMHHGEASVGGSRIYIEGLE